MVQFFIFERFFKDDIFWVDVFNIYWKIQCHIFLSHKVFLMTFFNLQIKYYEIIPKISNHLSGQVWLLLPINSPFFKNATHIYNSIKYLCTNKMGLSRCDENVVNDSCNHTLKWIVHISQVLQHIFVSMFLSTIKYKSSTKQDFKIITNKNICYKTYHKIDFIFPFCCKNGPLQLQHQ